MRDELLHHMDTLKLPPADKIGFIIRLYLNNHIVER